MNIVLVGNGRMGKLIAQTAAASADMRVTGIVDALEGRTFEEIAQAPDVVMDFSYPGNLRDTLAYATRAGCAAVIGTTGLSDDQVGMIRRAAERISIVFSYNFSMGVAVLRRALESVADALRGDFDIEIVEAHHALKADAPSGTAKLLLKAVDPKGELRVVNGREGVTGARDKMELGMHAIRGGSLAGEHSVLFLGDQETLCFSHSAASRQIFVNGALRAARFAAGRESGLYTMDDVLWGGKADGRATDY